MTRPPGGAASTRQATAAYRSVQAESSSGLALVAQAYEVALGHLRAAVRAQQEGRLAERCERLRRALDIVMELRCCLDREAGGEVAVNLDRLYSYFIARLTEAKARGDAEGIEQVASSWASLLEAWRSARREGT